MQEIHCKKPDTLLLDAKILMVQTSDFHKEGVQPYLQVGSMMPEDLEKLNRSLYEKEYWYGSKSHQHTSALFLPCIGNYARAFFFYPTEDKHFEIINMLLTQAIHSTSFKLLKRRYMVLQAAITLEGDEAPVETLIMVHYINA